MAKNKELFEYFSNYEFTHDFKVIAEIDFRGDEKFKRKFNLLSEEEQKLILMRAVVTDLLKKKMTDDTSCIIVKIKE